MLKTLAEPMFRTELARVDWTTLRDIRSALPNGEISASYVPEAVVGLITAESKTIAQEHYWRLENHVVVQGQTFESAEPLVSVLVASLRDEKPTHSQELVLELIFQLVAYGPHLAEIDRGNADLTDKCKSRAREGLWVLYELLLTASEQESEAVRLILDKIDLNRDRLERFIMIRNNSVV